MDTRTNHRTQRHAVAPVLATLLMIAVAVAMSVIIFMWSQGFLSQTSSSTGSQQGAQNQAAQSSIAIDTATFTLSSDYGNATIVIRNVGAVSVRIGSALVQGISSNAGFSGSVGTSSVITVTDTATTTTNSYTIGTIHTATFAQYQISDCTGSIAKGTACRLQITGIPSLRSGDIITIRVTTSAGTFAIRQLNVP